MPWRAGERARRRPSGPFADIVSVALRGLLRPLAAQGAFAPPVLQGGRRLVIVQLDGVSRRRLARAIAEGAMPFLAGRLASGRHVLSPCRSGVPASTPAFQAGLFYRTSPGVPGFAWVERETGREVRMDRSEDAAAVERRLPRRGPGLLRGGTAYFSVFSGDAALPHLCLSALAGDLHLERFGMHLRSADVLASMLARSTVVARAAARLGAEAATALADGLSWSFALGRTRHEPSFFLHRLLVGGVLRELTVQNVVLDVSRGVPVVFCDLLGFDQYAHRRGPDSRGAMRTLASADAALAAIFAAADAAPELAYDVYVLSDHGHVATRPFEAITGVSLVEYLARAERGERLPGSGDARPWRASALPAKATARAGEIAVAEAGDLAHVYFLGDRGPLPLPAIRERHRRALSALTASGAVGVLGVRGGRRGLALVRGATLDLADRRDVLRLRHPEPALAATYLSDVLALPEAGDVVVLGWRGRGRETVAYAWEFGSHGGIDPEELESFVVHPREVDFPFAEVVRPAELGAFFEVRHRAPLERATPVDRAR